jgi:hypothetical protein
VVRGEIPIELGASWFSPKCVEAQPSMKSGPRVKHCFDAGCESGTNSWQTQNSGLEIPWASETVGDKLHCQKGNSPDQPLRLLNDCSVANEVGMPKQPGG